MAYLLSKALRVDHEIPASGSCVIGRSGDCDLTINVPTISKRHARIFERDGKWYAEDLGSANSTYINGEKISRSTLYPGDYLRLDVYTLAFFVAEPPQLPEITVSKAGIVMINRLPITRPLLRIGRHVSNHIVIDDPQVVPQHVELERQVQNWLLKPLSPGVPVLVNEYPVREAVLFRAGDKLRLGASVIEISRTVVRQWSTVSAVLTRLKELHGTVRMQARTLEEAIRENFPAAAGASDWTRTFQDVFVMVDRSICELEEVSNTMHEMIPSMESANSDRVIIEQGLRASRRCNNLANYLDLVLHNHQLVRIQNADLEEQRKLVKRLHDDVEACLAHDSPTVRL